MGMAGVKRLSRRIFADVLAVGSVATAGPVLSPAQEAEILDGIEWRLQALWRPHVEETESQVAERFRRLHPELFEGTLEDRHRAALHLAVGDTDGSPRDASAEDSPHRPEP